MTNTFFCPGNDKLEDMIASIKHGYMLFETNNGMEDPKNWQIQCTAEYGIEIIDGKLTDNYVSPVVMSGSVPELLKSISIRRSSNFCFTAVIFVIKHASFNQGGRITHRPKSPVKGKIVN